MALNVREWVASSRWRRVVLALLVVLLIILVAAVRPRVRDNERFLSGFWSGDPAFLKKAGLSQMHLFIAPHEGGSTRQGHLVMLDEGGGVVSNQGVELRRGFSGRWASAFKSNFSSENIYRAKNVSLEYDDEDVMPDKMSLGLDPVEGTLSLYTDDQVYAFLVKDNAASLSANGLWEDND